MEDTTEKLNNAAAKIVSLLSSELDRMNLEKPNKGLAYHNKIIDKLSKLANLIEKLSKFKFKNEGLGISQEEGQKILEEFLARNR